MPIPTPKSARPIENRHQPDLDDPPRRDPHRQPLSHCD
jgi:hypothetical protein